MAPSGLAWLYILRPRSGALYIGSTTSLGRRWEEHRTGSACRTTARDPPLEVVHVERHVSFSAARCREAQLKRWTRAKKEALVAGELARLNDLAKRRRR